MLVAAGSIINKLTEKHANNLISNFRFINYLILLSFFLEVQFFDFLEGKVVGRNFWLFLGNCFYLLSLRPLDCIVHLVFVVLQMRLCAAGTIGVNPTNDPCAHNKKRLFQPLVTVSRQVKYALQDIDAASIDLAKARICLLAEFVVD